MNARQSLMDELEEAVKNGSRDKRITTLRRITDVFLVSPAHLTDEQIEVFDEVLTRLVARVESKARIELSRRLAPIEQAPSQVIHRLARDDEIAVAGPVLSHSSRLSTADLLDIADQKSQAHLLAIAGRSKIEQEVTSVLIQRGDSHVVHRVAANAGAAFSEEGYSSLVQRAATDQNLGETLGQRGDIPLGHLRELLLKATEAVRARLLHSIGPDRQDLVRRVLTDVSVIVADEVPVLRNVEDAHRLVMMMKETGRLNEAEVLTFAQRGKFEEMIAAIAVMCGVAYELVDRLMRSDRADALLVPCRAAGFGWVTVRAILEARRTREGCPEHDINSVASEFSKLSPATAARVLRFWQVRQTAPTQPLEQVH